MSRAPGAIRVDGTLDDPGWKGAARATGFTEFTPDKDVRPPRRSLVLVTYDRHALYVAFIACDDPSTIRATLADRDHVTGDDLFGLILDTYGSGAWAYELYVNPLGVQADWRRVGSVKDSTFDVVYHTSGRITSTGYQVEMSVPFASLRFPDAKEQRWRASFVRKRPRGSYEEYSWAAIDISDPCLLCEDGTLTGIRGVQPGGSLEVLPSAVGSSTSRLRDPSDPDSGFRGGGLDGSFGLGLEYAFPGGLTAQVTLNPDFSQVESDAAQVAADTTLALFFPEKRPFFQEGSDLYQTPIQAVYTRSVNDPQAAAKLTLRSGGTSVAWLGARDDHSPILLPFEEGSFVGQTGGSLTNVLRVQRDFGEDSHVGATVTDRRLEGGPGSNSVLGPDLKLHLGRHETFQYQLLASHTREPNAAGATAPLAGQTFDRGAHTAAFDGESFWGYAQYARLAEDSRYWQLHLQYEAYSPTFRAENGFVPQNDQRRLFLSPHVTAYPLNGWLQQVDADVALVRTWNFAGVGKQEYAEPYVSARLGGQTQARLSYHIGNERLRETDLRGIGHWEASMSSSFTRQVTLGGDVLWGEFAARKLAVPVVGDGSDLQLFATFKPVPRLVVSPNFELSTLSRKSGERLYRGWILRDRNSLQFSRSLFLRLVVQYDDFTRQMDVEPLLTYRINPFTLFYVGSSLGYHDYRPQLLATSQDAGLRPDAREFFAKFQYLLRF
ncbi:MAG TPA: DUF5916 domain-containing protein [Gemmatimonadota bacterium]|nr:DUF5916 domain-containing protein [Gemmatimonadota bacterium]